MINNSFIDLLNSKLSSSSEEEIKQIDYILQQEYECDLTAESEVGLFFHYYLQGEYNSSTLYDFLYKFTEYYNEDEDYLRDYANIIIYAVSEDWLDPIDGSRLIGSVWGNLGYPNELVEFIGTEGEIKSLDNKLRNKDLAHAERNNIMLELKDIRAKLKELAIDYIRNNTF